MKKIKQLNIFMGLPMLLLLIPLIIKTSVLFLISRELITIPSLTQLLPLSEIKVYNFEYLYKLVIAFTDMRFSFDRILQMTSLFDLLPFLMMMLIFEINRITKKNKNIYVAISMLLLNYVLKYLGLFAILIIIFKLGLNIVVGINYFGLWLMFTTVLFVITIINLIFSYYSYYKSHDYLV